MVADGVGAPFEDLGRVAVAEARRQLNGHAHQRASAPRHEEHFTSAASHNGFAPPQLDTCQRPPFTLWNGRT